MVVDFINHDPIKLQLKRLFSTKWCRSGVNFTNILWAAFAPVDLRPTYWRTAQSVQRESWADYLVLWTIRVGCSFVGETEQYLFVPSAVRRHICALPQWVGEIDPRSPLPDTFQHPLSPEMAARLTKRKKRQRQATHVLEEFMERYFWIFLLFNTSCSISILFKRFSTSSKGKRR